MAFFKNLGKRPRLDNRHQAAKSLTQDSELETQGSGAIREAEDERTRRSDCVAGSRIVHLSPLDGEIALSHKLSDAGARVLITSNLSALLPTVRDAQLKGYIEKSLKVHEEGSGQLVELLRRFKP